MNWNVSVWSQRLCLLLMTTWSITASANHRDYPVINDQLGQLLVQGMNNLMNDFGPDHPDYPTFTDEHYRARFREMSGVIEYRLNTDIKNHILRRTERYRSATERTLGLTEMYFPVFEEYLSAKGMPHHLKYLPIVESNLNPVAKSRASAVGLWQFIPGTAKLYGLTVSSHLDERSNTYRASDAATTMLSNLYKRYGDWALALAAYNCGPGRVDRYVKGNDKDYWDIRSSLPRETQMYVPYFMAVAYCYEYYYLHELAIKRQHQDLVLTDSIHLEPGYHSFTQLGERFGLSPDTLKRLNPGYLKNYIPSKGKHILVLPARIVAKFRGYEPGYQRIMNMRSENPIKCIRRVNNEAQLKRLMKAHRFTRQDLLFWNGLPSNYVIKRGDVMAIRKYPVPKDLWNKMQAPPAVEGISIASLEVVGLDDQRKKALTAPVYVNIQTKKLSNKVKSGALALAGKTTPTAPAKVDKSNPYQLTNKMVAVSAQPAKRSNIIDDVTQKRDRGRRLRTASAVEPAAIKAATATTAEQQAQAKAAQLAQRQAEERAAAQRAEAQAKAKAMKEMAQLGQKLLAKETQRLDKTNAAVQQKTEEQAYVALKQQTTTLEQSKTKTPPTAPAPSTKPAAEAKAAREAAELKAKQDAEAKAAREAAALKAKQEAEAKAAREAAALKAKQEADAKAAREAAVLKAKQEADAKAAREAAELKAKQEAEAKTAREAAALKAKQEAEAKAAREAAELKAKQEAEAKAAREAAALKAKEEAEAMRKAEELKARKEAEAAARQQAIEQEKAQLGQLYEYYTVKPKDTPYLISRQYRAKGIRVTAYDIMSLNNLTTETILHEGMQLKIRVK